MKAGTLPQQHPDPVPARQPLPQFSFSSGSQLLTAWDLGTPLTLAAVDGDQPGSALQQAVQSAFQRARAAGQPRPLLVGAIPFDASQPSCLYVPHRYQWQRAATAQPARTPQPPLLNQRNVPDAAAFKQGVTRMVHRFRGSDLCKAVLSVQRQLTFAADVDLEALRDNLRAQNPHGYLFQVPMLGDSTLLGVSPELLVRRHGNAMLSHPLAGSARRHSDPHADRDSAERLAASSKDHYEHQLVVDDIRHQLQGWCCRLQIPAQPSLTSTSALWHLATRIEAELVQPAPTALQLACRLHPTPAVCGHPTAAARQLIQSLEPFERGLFTGTVGWCDADGNGEWVVTIRCGTVYRNQVRLFAGAGIVAASDPDAEWDEVQTKLGTMLRACGLPQ